MPTENRSSNTEQMVSLPLDLVELALAHLPSDSAAGFELRELLAQPAAQHQGEPVFMVRTHGSCCWEESNGEGLDIALSMPDEYEVRKLYLHPPTSDGFSAGDMADQGAKAFREGVAASADFIQKRMDDYLSEFGAIDPENGSVELPHGGDEYCSGQLITDTSIGGFDAVARS